MAGKLNRKLAGRLNIRIIDIRYLRFQYLFLADSTGIPSESADRHRDQARGRDKKYDNITPATIRPNHDEAPFDD
ncbi:hypothetical protein RRSWK_01381 [Rhodopirellula sp. SWK7]|nr:hypothetical protein RRSWK_01381 [Rhodopirellula sp. SWK7]